MVPPGYPQPAPGYAYAPANPPTDGMAVASLVLGIVSIPGICCYGIVGLAAGITAIILGRMSIRKIRASGGLLGGNGLAQAGWICGAVGAVLGLIYALFTLAVFIFGIAGGLGAFPFATPVPSG
jgi:hypothetical protein